MTISSNTVLASTDVETTENNESKEQYRNADEISYDELNEIYNEYLSTLSMEISENEGNVEQIIDGFVQYMVDSGVIRDTSEQRNVIQKAFVRARFKEFALAGRIAGYTTAADYLEHSLQDSPEDIVSSSGSTYSTQILNSIECNNIVTSFKEAINGRDIIGMTKSGDITLNSTTDLHLAYNKVSYVAMGVKKDGIWKLTIVFKDVYDFETQKWKNAMTNNPAVTILNNYAAHAQSIGAIVPYNISISVETSFVQ